MNLIKSFISEDKYAIKCPYAMTPEFIVIHNTANSASAANEIAYMKRNNKKVSYHYAVDDIGCYYVIPENRNAWHAGDGTNGKGNRKGISIEICYSASGGEKFDKAEANTAELVADILTRYGWGIDKVKKHQDFSATSCPHRTLKLGWDRFLKMVQAELDAKKEPVATVNVGDLVKIIGDKYYNGKTIPAWVKKKNWYVIAVNGHRVVINKSEDGKNAINSPVNVADLELVQTFKPYKVTVTALLGLNVRKGPGTTYAKSSAVKKNTVLTIIAESAGTGAKLWGKTNLGWISLDYTKRV